MFNTLVGTILLPPLNLVLLTALGLWLARKRPRLGLSLSACTLAILTVFSTGVGARLLARPLENQNPALTSTANLDAQAIVVLGGGRIWDSPEYGGQDIPKMTTLGRLRYGAYLQRATGLPVLVTGGAPDGRTGSEAEMMARVLQDEMHVPVKWIENASDNTAQNAQYSAKILQEAGIQKIALVTDALHMPRARRAFEESGLTVVPAPTAFATTEHTSLKAWLPGATGMQVSYYAMHEWLGLLWYRLHRQSPPTFRFSAK
ncbi:uncharacterized SAM-binding protein YcdF (DUF218 family) [Paucimonas lemoignei]|uniref:Uncharacterized SAM-binding protein YcdF (DUF218 family) n=2 Tax=Paucimonas lemoignei TaxID=29443 RepID=A0A4R3HSH0_PAULE|nr:uncharacterized SAM-binding protein YcdF (DUF218 family) [Paucimonas lemoignei]